MISQKLQEFEEEVKATADIITQVDQFELFNCCQMDPYFPLNVTNQKGI